MKPKPVRRAAAARGIAIPNVPIEAVFSFLKGTKGTPSWSARDLAETLKLSSGEASKILPVLEMQGYIHPYRNAWVTTTAGEEVSGARPPRFTPNRIEEALADLRKRIREVNGDSKSPYQVAEAVAFGDYLENKTRVQPADVGIRLTPRKGKGSKAQAPAKEHTAQAEFLRGLRGKAATLHVTTYEDWMGRRKNQKLF
jgi:hypothetical protein